MTDKVKKEKDKFLETILGISLPWYIEKTEEDTVDKIISVYFNYQRGTKFKCPICNKECNTHDSSWRTWRHLNICEYKTYIHARIPTIKCCDKRPTVIPPWTRENSHFTLLMEDNILKLAKMSTITKVAKYLDEHDTKI